MTKNGKACRYLIETDWVETVGFDLNELGGKYLIARFASEVFRIKIVGKDFP